MSHAARFPKRVAHARFEIYEYKSYELSEYQFEMYENQFETEQLLFQNK